MLELKQFKSENCLSYLLWDRSSREAVIVDPSIDSMMEYRESIAEHGLKITTAIDLRTHSGHFSATHLFREAGAAVALSSKAQSPRGTVSLHENSEIKVGKTAVRVLETPGRSPDGIALVTDDFVLTGDVLLIGCVGHSDEPESNADDLWGSLQKLLKLPDNTLIYPSLDQTDLLCSSVWAEKKNNLDLQRSREAFVSAEAEKHRVNWDEESQKCRQFNRELAPEISQLKRIPRNESRMQAPEEARFTTITVDKYSHKLAQAGCAFIDVREPSEFLEGHIPGTKNIPLAQIASQLQTLRGFSRVYVSCLSGKRSERAAKTLTYLGLGDVVNVSGGFKAWLNADYPIEK